MRAWPGVALLVACAAKSPPFDRPRPLVPPPRPGRDSAIAVLYDPHACRLDIEDGQRKVFHWYPPDAPWQVAQWPTLAVPVPLIAIVPVPPGHYALVGERGVQTDVRGQTRTGAWVGYTNCDRPPTRVSAFRGNVEVPPHGVGLAAATSGVVGFDELAHLRVAQAGAWQPAIDDAAGRAHDQLLAKIREDRDGYTVYRRCDDGNIAVVHDPQVHGVKPIGPDDNPQLPAVQILAQGTTGGCALRTARLIWYGAGDVEELIRSIGDGLAHSSEPVEVDLRLHGPIMR
jgi:hypothetical protein